ncbi:alpha/beta hydrolase fold-domain-containing protein [Penicillium sp. IBT 16267x]|nr:alpha/beta hydrolase fold-domain-containing protein [Penicillium sp. IBT 16267x]
MSLQYDGVPPRSRLMLQQLAQFQKPALHDVTTRRAMTASMISALPPIPHDMERIIYHIPSDGYEVAVYHFRQRRQPEAGADPAILHIHGGAYISLGAEQCSVPHIRSVSSTGVQVLTIDYRLAPEHPYPKPLDDCWAVLKWLHANASQLSIDPARIAVMGESAGGGLAAALTLMARDQALLPPIAKQIVIHPMIDDRTNSNHADQLAFWDEKVVDSRVAIVTGATRGIGLATASLLAQNGARVVLVDLREDDLKEACAKIGLQSTYHVCDVSDWDQQVALFDQVKSTIGPIDLLVCNAAVNPEIALLQNSDPRQHAEMNSQVRYNYLADEPNKNDDSALNAHRPNFLIST